MSSLRFFSTPFLFLVCGIFMVSLWFLSCGGARVKESTQGNVDINLNELLKMSEQPVPRSEPRGGSSFLNSLISEFGDIPEVRIYHKHMETLNHMGNLSLDELIELLLAASVLYPSEDTTEALKILEEQREMLKASGLTDFPNKRTYHIVLNRTLGDVIKVLYPDSSVKESDFRNQKSGFNDSND